MTQLDNLDDLFHHQLKDLYSAETQLIQALPQMVKEASNDSLKDAFAEHFEETKKHKKRLEEIGENLSLDLTGETCEAMKGLIREAQSFIAEDAADNVKDAGIIADAQRVEHYEISAYGTVIQLARALNYNGTIELLRQTLTEEKDADETLNQIAMGKVNEKAMS